MSAINLFGMLLPGVVACNSDTYPEDPTYYTPTEITGDPDGFGDGTVYCAETSNRNEHLTRAWFAAGFTDCAMTSSFSIPYFTFADDPAGGATFSGTLSGTSSGGSFSHALTGWFSGLSGTPTRDYAFSSSPVHPVGITHDSSPEPTFDIPGINNAGNVGSTAATVGLAWRLPMDTSGTSGIGGELTDIEYYRFPAGSDADTVGTPAVVGVTATVSAYGNSACPLADGSNYYIVFYLSIRIDLYVVGHTEGDGYSSVNIWNPLLNGPDLGRVRATNIGTPGTEIGGVTFAGPTVMVGGVNLFNAGSGGTWTGVSLTFSNELLWTGP